VRINEELELFVSLPIPWFTPPFESCGETQEIYKLHNRIPLLKRSQSRELLTSLFMNKHYLECPFDSEFVVSS
jgi:hypothetical protein